MAIFSRRRLQAMLQELAPALASGKGKGLLRRLNNDKDAGQALPAEMELALLWAIGRLGDFEVEPDWWLDSKRPDAITSNLIPGSAAAVEIISVTDNAIAGEGAMDAIALQISHIANSRRKRTGDYLYFRFEQESGYEAGQYYRRRLAPEGFKLPDHMAEALKDWIGSGASRQHRLRLRGDGLDVEVEHTPHKQTRYHHIWSAMPPEVHSVEDNPLFRRLWDKVDQLRGAAPKMIRMIFIADVGNSLIRRVGRVGETDTTRRFVSGSQIIAHFLRKRSKYVDAVVTFSPVTEQSMFVEGDPLGRSPRRWTITFFGTPALPNPPERLELLAAFLPRPHYEGYQARSLFRQGAFTPRSRGQYLGMSVRTNLKDQNTIDLPARMLLDLVAGRLSIEQFHRMLGGSSGSDNIFRHWLNMGMTISGAEMAPRDLDEDDDHIILHFSDDPAARPFKLPNE